MNLTYREIDDWTFDYPLLKSWWERHDRDVIPLEWLQNGYCFFSEEEGQPMMFSSLILSAKGGICWLAWTMTNPDLKPYDSVRVIKDMLGFLDQWAFDMGFGVIFTACNLPSYGRLFESENFKAAETNITTYLKMTGLKSKEGIA